MARNRQAALRGEGMRASLEQKFGTAMKWLKTLTNPFLLGAQGFVAGAVIFFATHPDAAERATTPAAEQAKVESPRSRA